MTTEFALEYIPRRMQELGSGDDYLLKFRHFVMQPNDTLDIDAYNQYFLLVEAEPDLSVHSEFGLYNLTDTGINEQQYEHQGKISIVNNSKVVKNIKFIQVIPRN
jgi:hypothetical protein